jgi:O-antigen ligase
MNHYSVIDTPHNQYLNVLLETGLAGLVAFLALLIGCLRVGWRLYRTANSRFVEMFALGWLGYFAGMVAGGMTGDFILHSIRNGGLELFTGFYLQWVMLGMLVGLDRLEASAELTPTQEAA